MTLLVVGLSHQQTPLDVLERASVPREELAEQLAGLLSGEDLTEALLLSTCNRVEVYAEVNRFHGALDDLVAWLADRIGIEPVELVPYLQVRYGEEAIEHAFRVASGLDSLVVGEPQVLGQFRSAYLGSVDAHAVGRELHALAQHTLRVGKRVHSELGISELGRNIASVAIDLYVDGAETFPARTRAVILGAGAMASLAAHALRRRGVEQIVVVNRSLDRAQRLAEVTGARALPLEALVGALRTADLLVTAASSTRPIVSADRLVATERDLTVVDLSLPRNVDEQAAGLPSVRYIGLADVQDAARRLDLAVDAAAAHTLIEGEVADFLTERRGASVAPTVTALRAKAAGVVDAELARLRARIPDLDDSTAAQVEQTISRIVDKILHAPSVRVRELAGTPSGDQYAEALRTLFDLSEDLQRGALAAAAVPDVQEATAALDGARTHRDELASSGLLGSPASDPSVPSR